MKKNLIALGVLAVISSSAVAQEADYSSWLGGFIEVYKPDEDKYFNFTSYDAGLGLGIEAGLKFNSTWGGRIEYSRINLENDSAVPLIEDKADRYGIDAMYFIEEHAAYIFAGIKYLDMPQSGTMTNIGMGKHWDVSENFKVITEIAAYHDFGQAYNDVSAKLGLAYAFGGSTAAKPASDADQDGVFDNLDQCAGTAIGARVDSTGCTVDDDNDGVNNNVDQCANTPMGTKVDSVGCFWDEDGDGIINDQDACPSTPAADKVDDRGCTVVVTEQVQEEFTVKFANNSSEINVDDYSKFEAFADFMKQHGDAKASIEGHSSAPGEPDYNMMLSEKRAEAVKAVLVEQYDVPSERITTMGYGETQLIDTGSSAQANAANRRVDSIVSVKLTK